MRDYLIINGRNLKDFGLYAFGNSRHKFPERDVESVEIPGRTGNLTIDKGRWKNIEIEYSVAIVNEAEFKVDELRAFLLSLSGYVRIESTFEPEYYRMGRLIGTPTPKAYKEAATITLTFDCQPQKFLKSGELALDTPENTSATVYNPTVYTARPRIMIMVNTHPTGSIGITNYVRYFAAGQEHDVDVGHSVITVQKYVTTAIYIDCETQMAYTNLNESAMDKIVSIEGGDWPKFMPKRHAGEMMRPTSQFSGEVEVLESFSVIQSTNVDGLAVIPRWWTL